jgi:hypothetical protein
MNVNTVSERDIEVAASASNVTVEVDLMLMLVADCDAWRQHYRDQWRLLKMWTIQAAAASKGVDFVSSGDEPEQEQ